MAKKPSLESQLNELERIVQHLESDQIELQEALTLFEQGVALTKQCQTTLAQAELKIQQLMAQNDEKELVDFNEESKD